MASSTMAGSANPLVTAKFFLAKLLSFHNCPGATLFSTISPVEVRRLKASVPHEKNGKALAARRTIRVTRKPNACKVV